MMTVAIVVETTVATTVTITQAVAMLTGIAKTSTTTATVDFLKTQQNPTWQEACPLHIGLLRSHHQPLQRLAQHPRNRHRLVRPPIHKHMHKTPRRTGLLLASFKHRQLVLH